MDPYPFNLIGAFCLPPTQQTSISSDPTGRNMMHSALLFLLVVNTTSALGTRPQGSAASSACQRQTFRASTAVASASRSGAVFCNLGTEEVQYDSRSGGGGGHYEREAISTRRAFLSKVAALMGAAAGVLPAAVGAGEVRSAGEVKKGIEADFLSRYAKILWVL